MSTTPETLGARLRRGDGAAFAALAEAELGRVYAIAVAMTGDRALGEEISQETFLRAWTSRRTLREADRARAWLGQIARNASIDNAQKRRAEVIGIDEIGERQTEPVSSAPGPEESAASNQNLALLKRALERLPQDKRELLVLARFQGMKYEEIATVLSCEVGTEKVRVYRAMRALEQTYFALEKEIAS